MKTSNDLSNLTDYVNNQVDAYNDKHGKKLELAAVTIILEDEENDDQVTIVMDAANPYTLLVHDNNTQTEISNYHEDETILSGVLESCLVCVPMTEDEAESEE